MDSVSVPIKVLSLKPYVDALCYPTSDEKIAVKVRMLRDHGQTKKYHHEMEGYNGRCDALQAAALRVKLKHLPAWNEARRKNSQLYFKFLKNVLAEQIVIINLELLSAPFPIFRISHSSDQ